MVMPGNKMGDGPTLAALINEEGVTMSAGVPTVWLNPSGASSKLGRACRDPAASRGGRFRMSAIGNGGVRYLRCRYRPCLGYDRDEPLGYFNSSGARRHQFDSETFTNQRLNVGQPIYGVEVKITDDDNNELPWDGVAFGALKVRGPWICSSYFKLDGNAHEEEGWFETGDVATIDPRGNVAITDRTKDVIKSGGEWISSIEVENCAAQVIRRLPRRQSSVEFIQSGASDLC